MKFTILVCAVLLAFVNSTFAQATSPKHITSKMKKRVENRNEQTKEALKSGAAPGEKPAEPAPASASTPTPIPPPATPPPQVTTTSKPLTVVRPKPKSDKDSPTQKLINFQRQRAMSGQASAQYDLGMRYLNGDGLEENAEEGRKWIEKAAKQEYTLAVKKLEELNRAKQ